ncbi:hypothetical protein IEQ34_015879 [Dendrobium chrysotoxum]|uniref:noroxomaritidine synthase n=1 Tax=Dendrobium chrysotoxum TaxID=161865 RepID=A0AAV7GHZ3_DENCH|nr:hypothetical protein IEQ34_015879 [Dendrobium chrysotoxum]
MKYLHAALSETLRLYPSVPLNSKSCFSDDTLPDGFNVNRGDVVFYMPYPMGRMEILWGDDAENFQPERWLDDDGSVRNESPFKFTAFQAGPRVCLGKDFAYTEMKIFAAVLHQFFKFKLSSKSNDVHYKTMITIHIDQGLYHHNFSFFSLSNQQTQEMGHSLAVMAKFLQAIIILVLVLVAIKIIGRHGFWWRKAKKRYHPIAGTIIHKFLNFRRFFSLDNIFVKFQGQYNYKNLKELFGDGIVAVDGEKWRHQRKLVSYEFSARALRNYSTSVFKQMQQNLPISFFIKQNPIWPSIFRIIRHHSKASSLELFMSSTMDSIFKIRFSVDLMNLDWSVDGIKFTKAFDNASVCILSRYVDVFWKFKTFFNIGYEAQLKKDINVINDFIYNLNRAKKENMTNAKRNLEKKEDIISRFMAEMEHDPKNITYEYLRDIALNFVIAGKDTTARTLSWFIYLLCKHSSVQEKKFQEVKEATQVGQDICISEFAEKITEDSLEKMTYLHAALSETLRLYPSSTNSKLLHDQNGFNVNQGDIVFYMPYPMGRMEILWGDDAKNFQPKRWLDDDGSVWNESPFKFTAFQAGPRIFLGKDFAYTQMKIFAAVLLHFFKFKLSSKSNDHNSFFSISNQQTQEMGNSLAFMAKYLQRVIILMLVLVAIKNFRRHGFWWRKAKKRYHPIAGTIVHLFLNFRRMRDYLTDISCKYKTFRVYAPFRNLICTTDPAILEYILKTNFTNYEKGQYNYENLKELFGDGIFAVDGEKWHHQRKLASYEFSTRALRNYSTSVFKTNATKLAYIILYKAKSDLSFDIQELFISSTMDSIFKIGFGFDLMNLDGSVDGIKFTKAFDNTSVYIVSRFFNIGYEAKLKKDINVINDFIYNLIRAKKEKMSDAKSNLEKKEDIISRVMAAMEHDPKNITYEYLRDIVLNFVIAGKDTTVETLSWFIYLLCKHPSVQEEIFQEVKEATQGGQDICFNEFVEKITMESLDKMKYLHAALSETLRLYPSIPLKLGLDFQSFRFPLIDLHPHRLDGLPKPAGWEVLNKGKKVQQNAIQTPDDSKLTS